MTGWDTFHTLLAGLFFSVMTVLIGVVMLRHLRSVHSVSHTVAVMGLALVAVLGLAFTYWAEWYDLAHPGSQIPNPLRIAYTYILYSLGIASLVLWLHSDKRS